MAGLPIENYCFGRVIINHHTYYRDVIIFPHQISSPWWRAQGHLLQLEDLTTILREKPDTIVIGQGAYSQMVIEKKVQWALAETGIQLIATTTEIACQTYNDLFPQTKVIAALHLTC